MKINEIINEVANQPKGVAEATVDPYRGLLMALRQDAGRYIDTRGQAGGRNFVLDINQRLAQLQRTGNPRAKIVGDTVKAMIGDAQRTEVTTKGVSFGTLAHAVMQLTAQELQKVDQKPVLQPPQQGVAEELSEEFDLIESIIDQIADQNGVDSEVVWDDLESLTEDELYAFAVTSQLNEDWQKVNKQDKTDGMSKKAVNSYRREHPGSKLKTAVTTKPSKLKKGSKASKRRSSYCSRSKGQMKMHNISCAKTPDKAICKARRRWNC